MIEKVKLAKYVTDHSKELDEIMVKIFSHWNEIGKLDSKVEVSNRMQITWIISMIKIWLSTAGIPKISQKQILERLAKNL